MTGESLLSPGGTVRLGDFVLSADKLSARDEAGLRKALAAVHRDTLGPGGYFARAKPLLKWLRENDMLAEWRVLSEQCAALSLDAGDPGWEAIEEARRTPKGVAVELFARTRRGHPEVTLKELEAVVTEVNAPAVHEQIVAAVTDGGKAPAPSS